MPLCGFNKQMLDGLKQFHLGLVEHGILDRSENKNQNIQETIGNELSDMDEFLVETSKVQNKEMKDLIVFLTKYAKSFYKFIQETGIDNYKEAIGFLDKFYFEMDRKYYQELEGRKNRMRKLATHLNKIKPNF